MATKKFRAKNLLSALDVVKNEMGPDAVIVSVRKVLAGPTWQVWKEPLVEVVAVKPDEIKKSQAELQESKKEGNNQEVIFQTPVSRYAQTQSSLDNKFGPENNSKAFKVDLSKESKNIKNKQAKEETPEPDDVLERSLKILEQIKTVTNEKKPKITPFTHSDGLPVLLKKHYQFLEEKGIEKQLLNHVSKACLDSLSPKALEDEQKIADSFKAQMSTTVRTLKKGEIAPKITCLVGTSGSGKTNICAKLAVYLASGLDKKVVWICADTVRIGAIAEGKTYAESIGVDFRLAYTPEELAETVESCESNADHILVDTPAYNPLHEENVAELGGLLTALPRRSTWWIAPATSSEKALSTAYSVITPFRIKAAILSKLDETTQFAEVINMIWKNQIPLAYYSIGPRILNELVPAKAEFLIKALYEEYWAL